MYHEVGIQRLSDNQLSKLRNGHPVRIKLGNIHKIALSVQQLKKLHKAHKKGAATTISFDPYQMEQHGSGLIGDIAKKAKAFVQKYHLQDVVNPVISKAKRLGHHTVNRASQYAHSQLNKLQPIEGRGIFGGIFNGAAGLSDLIGGPGSGEASKVLNGIGGVANAFGLGVAHKHSKSPIKRKRRTKKGSGFVEDLGAFAKSQGKNLAKKGIEIGADYINKQIDGLGVVPKHRRIVGRRAVASRKKKTHSGGALFPSCYSGGALYPA